MVTLGIDRYNISLWSRCKFCTKIINVYYRSDKYLKWTATENFENCCACLEMMLKLCLLLVRLKEMKLALALVTRYSLPN